MIISDLPASTNNSHTGNRPASSGWQSPWHITTSLSHWQRCAWISLGKAQIEAEIWKGKKTHRSSAAISPEKARRHVQNLRSHCGWKKAHLQGEVQTGGPDNQNLPFNSLQLNYLQKQICIPACIWGGKHHNCSSQDELDKPAHQEASTWRCHRSGPWQLQTSGLPWAD